MGPVTGPVEKKVQASTAAAAVSGLVLWVLGRYAFGGSVPDWVASWVYAVIPGALSFAAGYLTRHTPRPPDPAPVQVTFSTVTASGNVVPAAHTGSAADSGPVVPPAEPGVPAG